MHTWTRKTERSFSSAFMARRRAAVAKESANRILSEQRRARIEYLEVVDTIELQPVDEINAEVRIAGAIWIGKTRLIDNIAASPR